MRSARSKTVTVWPARLSCAGAGQARRARADDRDLLAGALLRAARATTQPSSKPLSMIAHSMLLMVTGGSLMPSTHEPSQGAGQTRPVNSGKLLVLCRRVERLLPLPAVDEVVPLGDQVVDRAAGGHARRSACPVWQNGTPQSMQRAPCSRSVLTRAGGRGTRRQSRTRVVRIAVARQLARSYSMKPVGLPMARLLASHAAPRRARSARTRPSPPPPATARSRASSPAPRARAGSRSASPARTAARSSSQSTPGSPARASLPVSCACRKTRSCTQLDLLGVVERAEAAPSPCCSARRSRRPRRARRRCRPTCRRRSCGRSGPSTTTRPPVMYSQPWSPTALDDRVDAAVADAEALAGHAADVRLAAGRAVEGDVADDDVLLGDEASTPRGG